jgi:hypothetical protein
MKQSAKTISESTVATALDLDWAGHLEHAG